MRKAAALPLVLVAGFSCTYSIPALVDGGTPGAGDGASIAETSTTDGNGGADTLAADASGNGGDAATTTDAHSGSQDVQGGDAPCTGLLCPCKTSSDCSSRLCAGSLTVGAAFYGASGSFCSTPCCTSADCAAGAVCFGSGQGGNYCVNPSWLGRSTALGGAHGGASCTTDSQCRSGLCSSGGACADTCCSLADSTAECGGAALCSFGAFPGRVTFDQHFTGRCGPPNTPGYGYGAQCSDPSQCAGGLCYAGGCTNPCHSANECGAGAACQLGVQGMDVYVACFPWSATGAQGTTCSSNSVCKGDWCLDTGLCTDACFTDADCVVSGWHCSPQPDTPPTGTSAGYMVLACAP